MMQRQASPKNPVESKLFQIFLLLLKQLIHFSKNESRFVTAWSLRFVCSHQAQLRMDADGNFKKEKPSSSKHLN